MNNRFSEIRKWIIALIEILLIVALVYGCVLGYQSLGLAEDQPVQAFVICQPGDYVNARISPSRKSEVVGYLECTDDVWLDGKTNNGFAHCVDATFEVEECWVYTGYIVFDEPEWMDGQTAIVVSNGRLAARKNCTGAVRKWLQNGDEIRVFWWSDEWCVTNYGFVKTQYIDLAGE